MGYQNSFSRSISKSKIFEYCQRKYYFSYYTNGLRATSESLRLQALLLKNLKSLNMWIGSMIHELIASYLHSITDHKNFTAKQLLENYLAKLDQIYRQSKNKNYTMYDPKDKFWLSEHFYHQDLREEFVQAKENFKQYFQNFLDSRLHKEIIQRLEDKYDDKDSGYQFFIESVAPDFERMQFFAPHPLLTGIRILAQPDFGVVRWSQQYIIYDRKSGKKPIENRFTDQLKLYSYKILSKLKDIDYKKLKFHTYEVYLSDMTLLWWEITIPEIMTIEDKIVDSVMQMKEKIKNQDFWANIPIAIKHFPKTLDKNKCSHCRFRFVCGQID